MLDYLFVLFTFVNVIHAQDLIDDVCLECICRASSGCSLPLAKTCTGDTCGIFQITQPYWVDAGRFTKEQDHPDSPQAYYNCVSDLVCATTTVRSYMARFSQDCNRNGIVDCYDFGAIHLQGGYGCSDALPKLFANKLAQCLQSASNAFGNAIR